MSRRTLEVVGMIFRILINLLVLLCLDRNSLYALEVHVSKTRIADDDIIQKSTIQEAIDYARKGDSIVLHAGIYNNLTLSIQNKETSEKQPLIIKNAPNEKVIIDHGATQYAWWIRDQSHILIEGLEICNAVEGIVILGNSSNIQIKRCIIRDIVNRGVFAHGADEFGKYGYPENVEIANCEFYNIGKDTKGADIAMGRNCTNWFIHHNFLHGNVDGIVAANSSSGHIIEYNTIHGHALEDGIDLKDVNKKTATSEQLTIIRSNKIYDHQKQTGITLQQGTTGVHVIGNEIRNNLNGIWVNDKNTSNINILSNVISDNDAAGIVVNQEVEGNITIENNTIMDNGTKDVGAIIAGLVITAGDNYLIKGNSFINNSVVNGTRNHNLHVYIELDRMEHVLFDNNIYYKGQTEKYIRIGSLFYDLSDMQKIYFQDLKSKFVTDSSSVISPVNLKSSFKESL
jgi:hypothetical protein